MLVSSSNRFHTRWQRQRQRQRQRQSITNFPLLSLFCVHLPVQHNQRVPRMDRSVPRRLPVGSDTEDSAAQPPAGTAATAAPLVSMLYSSLRLFRFFVHDSLELETQGSRLKGHKGAGDGRGRRSRPCGGGGMILSLARSAVCVLVAAAAVGGGALSPSASIAGLRGFGIPPLRCSSGGTRRVGVGVWLRWLRSDDRYRSSGINAGPNGSFNRIAALRASTKGEFLRRFSLIDDPAKDPRRRKFIVVGSVSQRRPWSVHVQRFFRSSVEQNIQTVVGKLCFKFLRCFCGFLSPVGFVPGLNIQLCHTSCTLLSYTRQGTTARASLPLRCPGARRGSASTLICFGGMHEKLPISCVAVDLFLKQLSSQQQPT